MRAAYQENIIESETEQALKSNDFFCLVTGWQNRTKYHTI